MSDSAPGERLSNATIATVATSVVGLWVLAWVLTVLLLPTGESRAQFGDMFGSVNALFSGLALAGVVVALVMQHHELTSQRQELVLTRQQLGRTAAAQERTAEIAGLVAIVDHYGIRIHDEGNATRKIELEGKRRECIERLAQLIAG